MTDCAVLRIDKQAMMEAAAAKARFSTCSWAYLLARNIRYERRSGGSTFQFEAKRLARILSCSLVLARKEHHETVVPKISQEMLAEMIGTTRSRVSFIMNRFRKLGFIHYNGGLQVHSSLLNVVLHD